MWFFIFFLVLSYFLFILLFHSVVRVLLFKILKAARPERRNLTSKSRCLPPARKRSVEEVRAPAKALLEGLAAERLVVLKAGLAS